MRRSIAKAVLAAISFSVLHHAHAQPTFALDGAVVDSQGSPVPQARVWLCQERKAGETTTDELGRFHFDSVKGGHADVVAFKEGHSIGGISGEVLGPDSIQIALGTPQFKTLRFLDRGKPLAGTRIKWMVVGVPQGHSFTVPLMALVEAGFPSARSDDDGYLRLDHLPDGAYLRLAAYHRDYAEQEVPYLNVDGQVQALALLPGVRLAGRITSPSGEGVPDALVSAFRVGGQGLRRFGDAETASDGYYAMNLRPGEYVVSVLHPDYASPRPTSGVLRPDQTEETFNAALLSAHYIEGRVLGPEGEAMGGVHVGYLQEGTVLTETMSYHDGTYLLRIPSGKGVVRIIPPTGYMHANRIASPTDVAATEPSTAEAPVSPAVEREAPELPSDISVEIASVERVKLSPITLIEIPEVTGKVVGPDGETVANAVISTIALPRPLRALSGADGTFRLRLGEVWDVERVRFRAEHPLRLLRSEFTVNLNALAPVETTLATFEPNIAANNPKSSPNDLESLVGEAAPAIRCGEWFNAEPIDTAALGGKVIVLVLWGGFAEDEPSIEQLDELNLIYPFFAGETDVQFIGVHDAISDGKEIEAYIKERRIAFPVGRDEEPFLTFEAYKTTTIPQVILIDKKGVLRYYDVRSRLLELIKSLRREG